MPTRIGMIQTLLNKDTKMKHIFTALVAAAALWLLAGGPQVVKGMPLPNPAPNIHGVWYMHGDPYLPCEIVQIRRDGRALFTNEHGSSAWGTVDDYYVWIPGWSDGRRMGLVGRIRGDRIIWPNGSFWAR
jgi:hypothetical protein